MPGPSTLESPLVDRVPSVVDARVGSVLADRYRIDSLLGEGGMGRVYAAEHVLMRKRLAVKVLHRELTTVPEVVQRFEREAMAAANIEHPNVAAATDFGKLPDGAVFLVLEYVQGKNLRDEIAQGPLGVERALHIGRQIASALASAHALDIVHRDLKPENVMLVEKAGDTDFVKVLDFGIAKVPIGEVSPGRASQPITKVGMVFGTPEYMAPEQALGQTVDGRADLYALGVIIYEMVSGMRPFSSQSQVGILGQQLSKSPPAFAERAPGIVVPTYVEQLVMKLLAKEVGDRYQTALAVVEAINEVLGVPLTRGGRRFTQLSGSPNSVLGSEPRIDLASFDSAPIIAPEIVGAMPLAVQKPGGSAKLAADDFGSAPELESAAVDAALKKPGTRKAAASRARMPEPVERVLDWVDARRDSLPPPVQRALRDVPTVAFVGGAMLLVLGVLIGSVLLGVSFAGSERSASKGAVPQSTTTPSVGARAEALPADLPKPNTPAPEELASARKEGVNALERLALRYPRDTALLIEIARTHDSQKKHAQAVGAIGRALSIDAKVRDDVQVSTALFKAAQTKDSSDASFALLEGPMGSRGADIVYDLATTRGVRPQTKQRAEAWLRTKDFERVSSAPLNIAVSLKYAVSCQQKYGLLLRAKNVGDERSLPHLKQLQAREGCGRGRKDDCYACLRRDKRLNDAIAAVAGRSKAG